MLFISSAEFRIVFNDFTFENVCRNVQFNANFRFAPPLRRIINEHSASRNKPTTTENNFAYRC